MKEGQGMSGKPDAGQTDTEAELKAIHADMMEVKRTLSTMTEVLAETNHILRLMAAAKDKTFSVH